MQIYHKLCIYDNPNRKYLYLSFYLLTRIKDTPYTTSLAAVCNIVSPVDCPDKDYFNMDNVPPSHSICDSFPTSKPVERFTIYPLCSSMLNRDIGVNCSRQPIEAMFPSSKELWGLEVFDSATTDLRFAHAVCTVQTFQNVVSGPMLYMFTRYYLELGWVVIVYDRFGAHHDFLSALESQYNEQLKYYPYTLYQLIFPDIYTSQIMHTQVNIQLKYCC